MPAAWRSALNARSGATRVDDVKMGTQPLLISSARLVIVAALAVALATSVALYSLQIYADHQRQEAALFLNVDGLIHRLQQAEIAARSGVSSRTATRDPAVAVVQAELNAAIDDLARFDGEAADFIRGEVERYLGESAALADLAASGNLDEVESWAQDHLDPIFPPLDDYVEREANAHADYAATASRIVRIATLVGTIGSALVISALFIRFERSRRMAAQLGGERRGLERYRALIERATDMVVVLDGNGVIRYSSPSVERMMGYAPQSLEGADCMGFVHPDDAELVRGRLGVPPPHGHGTPLELRVRDQGGAWRWLEAVVTHLLHDPAVEGIVVNARDITLRKRAEAAHRASERRFRALIEQLPAVTYIQARDDGGTTYFSSKRSEELTGWPGDAFVANPEFWTTLIHPDDLERVIAVDRHADETGEPYRCEYRQRRPDGSYGWIRDEAVLVDEPDSGEAYWLGVVFDITEQKETEASLRQAEAEHRSLVERLPAVVYLAEPGDPDAGHKMLYVSPQFERLLGYSAEEWLADPKLWFRMLHPEDHDRIMAEDRRTETSGERYSVECRMITRTGETIWVREDSVLIRDADGTPRYWQGVMLDVTAQKNAEAKLRALIERTPAVIYIEDLDEVVAGGQWPHSYSSPMVEQVFGYRLDEWSNVTNNWEKGLHPDDRERVLAEDRRTEETGEPFRCEYRWIRPDGRMIWIRDEAVLIRDERGAPLYWQGIQLDITAEKVAEAARLEAEAALKESEQQFRLLFAANPYPMWVYDRETLRFLEVNEAAIRHYGYRREEFLAMTIADIRPEEDLPSLVAVLGDDRPELRSTSGWRHLLRDGRLIDVEVTSHLIPFQGRRAVLVVAQDVTSRIALESELAHRAFHDGLTGLPNRALFLDRLSGVIDRLAPAAVLFVDLDDFKIVNDTLGHREGDELLIGVAMRLRAAMRPGDTLARLGGDEFTLLLEGVATESEASAVAEQVAEALRAPFELAGREIFATPSIGIALTGLSGQRADDLLRAADLAMYTAKRSGKGRWALFEPGMDERAWKRLELEASLRRAIDGGELLLHYQPMIDLTTGAVTQVEALVRWNQPGHGLVLPASFIPLAEESGLMLPLGRWVLREACRQARVWQCANPANRDLIISVNLSARQFQDPDLIATVAAALRDADLAPECLELEITETAALEDMAGAMVMLGELKALGVRLAIDDFGAGYSGLSYLRRCPIDALKIDRSYIAGLGNEMGDEALIRAVLVFARTMGLMVTAEGVETIDQVVRLQDLGCDLGQGYAFARPLPPEALSAVLGGVPLPSAPRRAIRVLAG